MARGAGAGTGTARVLHHRRADVARPLGKLTAHSRLQTTDDGG
jgi:hypothetical protein